MKALLASLRTIEMDLSNRLGGFELFGLFRLRRAAGWTLVIAAPWVDPGLRPTVQLIIDELKRVAGPAVLLSMPRIMLFPDSGFLETVQETVTVEHGLEVVGPGDYGNVEVARGYVITSRRPATTTIA